jgi:cobalt/nickel transport system permease protein
VINFVKAARPEILESVTSARPLSADISIRKVLAGLLVVAMLTGGMLSWFASANPDGLEWSIEKVFGKPELPEQENAIVPLLKGIQEKTAFLPDYSFKRGNEASAKEESEEAWPNIAAGTSVSGIAGAIMVLSLIIVFGLVIKISKKFKVKN